MITHEERQLAFGFALSEMCKDHDRCLEQYKMLRDCVAIPREKYERMEKALRNIAGIDRNIEEGLGGIAHFSHTAHECKDIARRALEEE